MLQKIEIQRYRGIKYGVVAGMAQLTVLIGKNNSGKSTVVEAVQIGLNTPGATLISAAKRRGGWTRLGTLAEMVSDNESEPSRVTVSLSQGTSAVASFHRSKRYPIDDRAKAAAAGVAEKGTTFEYLEWTLEVVDKEEAESVAGSLFVDAKGKGHNSFSGPLKTLPQVRVVEPDEGFASSSLAHAIGQIQARGADAHEQLMRGLATFLPGIRDVRAVYDDGHWTMNAVFQQSSVSLQNVGDGTKRHMAIVSGLVSGAELVVLEEPERCQHPSSLREIAQEIWVAVDSGVQVIVTTHSHDLLQLIEGFASQGDRDARLAVLYTELQENGVLAASDAKDDWNLKLRLAE